MLRKRSTDEYKYIKFFRNKHLLNSTIATIFRIASTILNYNISRIGSGFANHVFLLNTEIILNTTRSNILPSSVHCENIIWLLCTKSETWKNTSLFYPSAKWRSWICSSIWPTPMTIHQLKCWIIEGFCTFWISFWATYPAFQGFSWGNYKNYVLTK